MRTLGKYFLFLFKLVHNMERFKVYASRVFEEGVKLGTSSITIVTIVSTFIGAVTCVQTAFNLVSPFIQDSVIATVVRDMTILEPNVTFHMIAVMQFGEWGVEASEAIRITDKGCELFCDFSKDLHIK